MLYRYRLSVYKIPYLVDRESVSADRLCVYDNYLRGNTY